MKIAMIDPSLFTLPYDVALCSALLARGCDVTLYGRELRPLEFVPRECTSRAYFYGWSERIKARGPSGLFRILKGLEHAADMARLTRLFRREGPMVAHFQWLPLPAIDITLVRRIRKFVGPVVLTVHDMTPFNGAPTSAVQRIGSTNVWREFDHLIVHGEPSKVLLMERGIPAERVSAIPHGILDVVQARAPRPRDADKIVILQFGRIKAYKGIDLMIDAIAGLPATIRTRCQLLVVGEPMIPIEPLMKRAEMLGVAGNIEWDLRYVSELDMGEVFSRVDIFAFPYREIDTSGVLMSCLPYGKPIIASDIGAFRRLLRNGVHGRIVPPNDAAALTDAIGDMLIDPQKLRYYGRNVALLSAQIPSWDAIAGRTMELYEALMFARAAEGRLMAAE